ncbi:hypothetical protein [Ruegeria pomeroyi]|uniref:hypothetical protein n=1 Tax=Ruegeria pomeroyi TaxID=89184 RepID=UPI002E2B2539|nr:hypothetical protein [Ruegeria pomeroyi]
MVDRIMAMEGARAAICWPPSCATARRIPQGIPGAAQAGLSAVKVDGQFYELDEPPTLDKKFRHDIDVVVDRIVVREGLETRLADSLRTALDLASGIAILETAPRDGSSAPGGASSPGEEGSQETEEPLRITFSETLPVRSRASPSPRSNRASSRSTPPMAPARMRRPGGRAVFDERLVVPDQSLKVYDGALAPWRKGKSPYFLQTIEAIARHYQFDKNTPWKDLPEKVQQVFLRGSGDEEIPFRYDEGGRVYQVTRSFEGVIPNMERRYRETDSNWIREEFEQYQNNRPCGACGGFRLKPEALAVKIAGLHVGQVVQMSIREALAWAEAAPASLSKQKTEIAQAIFKEIRERLGFLNNVDWNILRSHVQVERCRAAKASASAWPVRSARA